MFIVDEKTWTYKLFLKGLDSIEITEALQYMNTEAGSRVCGYFEDYPLFGRYFLKISDSILGFSVVNKFDGEERFALSRFKTLSEATLRVYYHNNKQRGDVPPLSISNMNNESVSLPPTFVETLASGVMYREFEVPEGTFVSGMYTLFVGEGVRETDVPLVYVGENQDWDSFEEFLGNLGIEFNFEMELIS